MTLGDAAYIFVIFAPVLVAGLLLIAVGLRRRRERSRSYLSQPGDYAAAISTTGVRLACEESRRRSRARRG
jgi:hypothetical protein